MIKFRYPTDDLTLMKNKKTSKDSVTVLFIENMR